MQGNDGVQAQIWFEMLSRQIGREDDRQNLLVQGFAAFITGDVTMLDRTGDTVVRAIPIPASSDESHSPPLFVSVTYDGTGHYVGAWALHETPRGVRVFSFEGCAKSEIRWDMLQDLDGDGIPEIVMTRLVGEYLGVNTLVMWPAIHRWDGRAWIRADERFPAFYNKTVIPVYQKILTNNPAWADPTRCEPVDHENYEMIRMVLKRAADIVRGAKK